jgi:hypothetical protein
MWLRWRLTSGLLEVDRTQKCSLMQVMDIASLPSRQGAGIEHRIRMGLPAEI